MTDKKRILIISDKNHKQSVITKLFPAEEFDVDIATSVSISSLQELCARQPDIVVLTSKGESNTELDIAGSIQSSLNVPILYLADGDSVTSETALFGYILTPFNKSELNEALESAYNNYHLEQQLRKSKAHYKNLFQKMQDAFAHHKMIYDERGKPIDYEFISVNPAFERIIGLSADQLIGRRAREVISDLEQFWIDRYGHVAKTGESIYFEKYSTEFNKYFAVTAYSPDPDQFAVIFEDISDRKHAENNLKKSEETLKSVLHAAPIGIGLATNRVLEWVNEHLIKMTGYERNELVGNHSRKFYTSQTEYDRVGKILYKKIAKFDTESVETQWVKKDGSIIDLLLNVSAIVPGDPSHGFVFTAMDITERNQNQNEREQLIDKLELQNAELERVAYTASHDLRNPLTTIEGFLCVFRDDAYITSSDELRSCLDRINLATSKMHRLLDELLDLFRIGRIINTPEKTSFYTLLDEALDQLEIQIESRGVTITRDREFPTVYGDKDRIREVLVILIDNAIKYMDDTSHPHIHIGTKIDQDETVFYVKDNGIGVNQRYFNKIFCLFDKLDTKSEGTGVGLTLAKRIIMVHGGKIWIESKGEGKGSTFCFTLPLPEPSTA